MFAFVVVTAGLASAAALPAIVGTAAIIALSRTDARAGTAILPGWAHSCGRDPRCFERGEARRRARGLYVRSE
jgi:hypothetical protein